MKHKLSFILVLCSLFLTVNRVKANDYMEHTENYTVYATGIDKIHFTIPVWVHGAWYEKSYSALPGSCFSYIYKDDHDNEHEVKVLNWLANVGKDNDKDNDKGQLAIKFQPNQGQLFLTCMHNGVRYSAQPDGNWSDWLTVKQKPAGGYDRVTFLEFDWYPPELLDGKEFSIKMHSEFDNFGEICDEMVYSFCSGEAFIDNYPISCYDHVSPDYTPTWTIDTKFQGKAQLVTPTLFEPYLYQMSEDGVAGYGYAAIPYSLADEPIKYQLSNDTAIYLTKDLAGNIYVMTTDTIMPELTAKFTVWRNKENGTIDSIVSTKVDVKPYHRIYDFAATEEVDSTGTYTGANLLNWKVKNPLLSDIIDGDYFEVVRSLDTSFTSSQSIAVIPLVTDSTGEYNYKDEDRSISTGHLDGDSLTHPLIYAPDGYYELKNNAGNTMFLVKLQIKTDKAVMPSLPIYYRVRRASAAVWGWHEDFMSQRTVYKHNFLAPLAIDQPEYTKDADFENNHQVNFRIILKNEEVPTILPSKPMFDFSYTVEHSGYDSVIIHTDFDTQEHPVPGGESYGAAITVTKPDGSAFINVRPLTEPADISVPQNSQVTIMYLNYREAGMSNYKQTDFKADKHYNVHFEMGQINNYYIKSVTTEEFSPAVVNPETYMTDALKAQLKDSLYNALKAEYESNPFGKCMWDKTANLVLIRTIEETGKSTETIIPQDSIHRLANGDWEARFSDIADKGCTHYSYSVRIDQSHADLHVRNPQIQLSPRALFGPDLYFDESAKIVSFTASQGDARTEYKQGVLLNWRPSSSAVDEYKLCRIVKGSSDAPDTLYTGQETSFIDATADPDVHYEYTISSYYNCNGKSTSNSATTEGWRTPYGEISGSILMPDNSGMAGVEVLLQDSDGTVIRRITTGSDGAYLFDSLEYIHTVILPQKVELSYDHDASSPDPTSSTLIRLTDKNGDMLQDWTNIAAGMQMLAIGTKVEVTNTTSGLYGSADYSFTITGNGTLVCRMRQVLNPMTFKAQDQFVASYTPDGTINDEHLYSRVLVIVPTHEYAEFSFNNTTAPTATVELATDNAIANGINFMNTNSTRLSGRALYENTTIPVAGAMFLLNGDTVRRGGAPLTTGTDGNFELSLTKDQPYTLQIFKMGHTFVQNGYFQKEEGVDTFYIDKPLDGIRFYDQTKVRLVGRVAGGIDQRDLPEAFGLGKNNLGDDLQLVLQLEGDNVAHFVHDPNDLTRDTVQQTLAHLVYTTDPLEPTRTVGITHTLFEKKRVIIQPDQTTGEFEVDLYPVKYKVTQATAKGYATLFGAGAGNETFDLTNAPMSYITDSLTNEDANANAKDYVHYNATYDRIYRNPVQVELLQNLYGVERPAYGEPEMEVNGANPNQPERIALYTVDNDQNVTYTLGYPVFNSNRKYQFKAKAYEAYYYNNDKAGEVDVVPQRGGTAIIRNGLHSATEVELYPLNEKGENNVIWLAVDDVDVEHAGTTPLRSVSVALEEEGNVVETNVFSAFVTGTVVEQKSLRAATGSINLLDIIRDPGGAGSSTYVENGAEYTFSFAQSMSARFGIQLSPTWGNNVTQYIGIYSGAPAGGSWIGSAVQTQKAFSFSIPIAQKIDYGSSYTCKLTTNERIETSSDAGIVGVGSNADVFFGTTVSNLLGKAKTISIIDDSLYQMCQPSLNAGTMLLLAQGTDTTGKAYYLVTGQKVYVGSRLDNTFTYSQYYIWNTLIPRLAMDRQNLLKNFTDSAAAQAYADATGQPTYWYYQTGEYLNDTIPLDSYRMFTPNDGGTYIDEVGSLNMAITRWLEILYLNEREKVEARTKGAKVGTFSTSFGNSFSHGDTYNYEYSYNEFPQNMALKGAGITAGTTSLFTLIGSIFKNRLNTSAMSAFLQTYWNKGDATSGETEDGTVNVSSGNTSKKVEEVAAKVGNMEFHLGFDFIKDMSSDKRMTTTASTTKSTGFTLVPDPMGTITTSVYKAEIDQTWYDNSAEAMAAVQQSDDEKLLYGSYVFFTEAGATMCPHEDEERTILYNPGTVINNSTEWVAKPELTADVYEVANVNPANRATFRITLLNQGQMDAGFAEQGQGFYLCLDGASNPDGAKVYVNGAPLLQSIYYWLVPGTPLTQTIEVERGTVDDYNLTLSLYSEYCARTSAGLNLGVHFLPLSSDVAIAYPRQNWLMNTLSQRDSTGYYLPVTIDEFDIHHKNFDHIEFQYKLSSESEEKWVNLCSFFADDSLYALASGNKAMIENGRITPFRFYGERDPMEQRYDLRAVSFCRYGSGFVSKSSPVISGIKDTRPPRVFGEPEPANSILGVGDHLKLRFNEPIAGNYLDEDNNFRIVGVTNETGISSTTALHFDGNSMATTKVKRDLASKSYTLDLMIHPDEATRTADMLLLEINNNEGSRQFLISADNRLLVKDSTSTGVVTQASKPLGEILSYVRAIFVYNYTEGKMHFYAGTEDMTDQSAFNAMKGFYPNYNSTFRFGNGFKGNMLETRIWTKALTEEEIATTNDHYLTGYEQELLAYYRMNEGKGETVADRAHGATLYLNGCSWSMEEGFSLALDGTTKVALAKNILDRSAAYDETVTFWFKTAADGTLFTAGRSEGSDTSPAKGQRISIENGALTLYDADINWTAKGYFSDNEWHHFVLTINRTYNAAIIYVDGQMYVTTSANKMSGILGAMYFGGDGFTGNIDEFAVFEQALPKSMIEEYNEISFVGDEMGLIGYLPFEEQYLNPSGVLQLRFSVNDQRQFKNPETGEIINKVLPLIDSNVTEMADHNNNAPTSSHGRLSKLHFDWTFNNDELLINILNQDYEVNKQSIYITIRDVEDLNGNPMASPVTWTAFVDHNNLKWSDKMLDISTEYGQDDADGAVTVHIINNSGKRHTYRIESLPAWMSVDKQSGTMDPMGEQTVTLYYDLQLAVGVYNDVIYLTDENGLSEPLQISYSVVAYPPYDDVDVGRYPLNMSVCGQVQLSTSTGDKIYDNDEEDIVYAFYRNECVGIANITVNTITGAAEVYLTIHGNDEMVRREINFQLWQASTGRIFDLATNSKIIFTHGNVCGCGDEQPVLFYTTGSETQNIELATGWSWISTNLYLETETAPINEVMTAAEPWTEGDIIKGPATRQFCTYGDERGEFIGSLTGWDYKQMYMVYAKEGNTMRLSGENLPTGLMYLTLRGDGQWNSFPCLFRQATSITEALADYYANASAGDIIKSHNSFAVFTSDNRWAGDLMALRPGEGYLMRRMGLGTVIIHFFEQTHSAPRKNAPITNHQSPITNDKWGNNKAATNMTMICKIEDQRLMTNNQLLKAFIGNELVGVATKIDSLFFITISSDANGSNIEFRTADGDALKPITNNQSPITVTYAPNAHHGSLNAPVLLVPDNDNSPYKIIENDHVVIIRNNEKYDVTGKKL